MKCCPYPDIDAGGMCQTCFTKFEVKSDIKLGKKFSRFYYLVQQASNARFKEYGTDIGRLEVGL